MVATDVRTSSKSGTSAVWKELVDRLGTGEEDRVKSTYRCPSAQFGLDMISEEMRSSRHRVGTEDVPAISTSVIGPTKLSRGRGSRWHSKVEAELDKQLLDSNDPGVRGSLEVFTMIGMCLDLCGLGVRSRNVS